MVNGRLDLSKQLNFGFQDFLHVADFLLPLRQVALQLHLILTGQALRSGPDETTNITIPSTDPIRTGAENHVCCSSLSRSSLV